MHICWAIQYKLGLPAGNSRNVQAKQGYAARVEVAIETTTGSKNCFMTILRLKRLKWYYLLKINEMKNLARVLCCFKPILRMKKGLEHGTQKNGESFALYLYFEGFLWGYRLLDSLRCRNKGCDKPSCCEQDCLKRSAATTGVRKLRKWAIWLAKLMYVFDVTSAGHVTRSRMRDLARRNVAQ